MPDGHIKVDGVKREGHLRPILKAALTLGILSGCILSLIWASAYSHFSPGLFYTIFRSMLVFSAWAILAWCGGAFFFFADRFFRRQDLQPLFSLLSGFWIFFALFPGFSFWPWTRAFLHAHKATFIVFLLGLACLTAVIRHFFHEAIYRFFSGRSGHTLCFLALALFMIQIISCSYLCLKNSRENRVKSNVVIFLLDALRADRLHCYGYSRPTSPFMDKLAGEGVRFANAIAQAPVTYPSVYCLFTSRPASDFFGIISAPAYRRRFEPYLTLPELLMDRGYKTIAVSSSSVVKVTPPVLGEGRGYDQGFLVFDEVNRSIFGSPEAVVTQAIHHLDRYGEKRFFMYLHFMDPHDPYESPEPYNSRFLTSDLRKDMDPKKMASRANDYFEEILRGGEAHPASEDLEILNALYDGEILYADSQIGRFVHALESRGLRGNTVIIITSDHGEEFYEHGFFKHCYNLYDEVLKIPLIFSGHRIKKGLTFESYVQSMDVAPTILGLLNLPVPPVMQGEDLSDTCLYGKPPVPGRNIVSETHYLDSKCLYRSDRWKYIHHFGGGIAHISPRHIDTSDRLFDLKEDPGEKMNLLSGREENGSAELAKLLALLPEEERKRLAERGKLTIDEETRERLRAIGYLR